MPCDTENGGAAVVDDLVAFSLGVRYLLAATN